MTPHTYRLHSFAPRPGWVRWCCPQCGREVEQGEGRLVVVTAGESVAHAGAEGRYSVWDDADLLAPWRDL